MQVSLNADSADLDAVDFLTRPAGHPPRFLQVRGSNMATVAITGPGSANLWCYLPIMGWIKHPNSDSFVADDFGRYVLTKPVKYVALVAGPLATDETTGAIHLSFEGVE